MDQTFTFKIDQTFTFKIDQTFTFKIDQTFTFKMDQTFTLILRLKLDQSVALNFNMNQTAFTFKGFFFNIIRAVKLHIMIILKQHDNNNTHWITE